jgi:hypothetical protein
MKIGFGQLQLEKRKMESESGLSSDSPGHKTEDGVRKKIVFGQPQSENGRWSPNKDCVRTVPATKRKMESERRLCSDSPSQKTGDGVRMKIVFGQPRPENGRWSPNQG